MTKKPTPEKPSEVAGDAPQSVAINLDRLHMDLRKVMSNDLPSEELTRVENSARLLRWVREMHEDLTRPEPPQARPPSSPDIQCLRVVDIMGTVVLRESGEEASAMSRSEM